MVLEDIGLPSCLSAGFPNKVAIPRPDTSSLGVVAHHEAGGVSLDAVAVWFISHSCCNNLAHTQRSQQHGYLTVLEGSSLAGPISLLRVSQERNESVGRAARLSRGESIPLLSQVVSRIHSAGCESSSTSLLAADLWFSPSAGLPQASSTKPAPAGPGLLKLGVSPSASFRALSPAASLSPAGESSLLLKTQGIRLGPPA